MREILFRGKRMDNGEWVEGSFVLDGEAHRPLNKEHIPFSNCYIVPETDLENIKTRFNDGSYFLQIVGFHVNPETAGQFTGLTDKNGKKIFEGDIVEVNHDAFPGARGEVFFSYGSFILKKVSNVLSLYGFLPWCEVIGNIHDNPELLEVSDAQ